MRFLTDGSLSPGLGSGIEPVAGINLLKPQQDFVYVEWIGVLARKNGPQDLEDVFYSLSIVHVGVNYEFQSLGIAEECELEVTVEVRRLQRIG